MCKKMIRTLAFILSVVMCLMLFTACWSSDNGQKEETSQASSSQIAEEQPDPNALPEFPLATPITIKAMIPEIGGAYKEVPAMAEFTKKTGISIEFDIAPIEDYKEKQMVILASGSLPDAMCIAETGSKSVSSTSNEFGSQGMLVNFKDYFDRMPNLQKWAEKFPKIRKGVEDEDGNFYTIPDGSNTNAVYESYLINEKAFQANGISIPATVDEFYSTLKKLKELYPESSPFIIRWGLGHLMSNIARTFNTYSGVYYNAEQDKYVYGPIEENYKKCLQFLNKLYTENLLDHEFATLSDEQWKEKLLNNKAFVTFDYKHETRTLTGTLQDAGIQQKKTDFKLAPIAPPKNEGKDTKYWGAEAINLGWGMSINAKSQYVKELVKLADWQLGDEYITLTGWGIEGTSYKMAEGKKMFVDTLKNAKNPNGTLDLNDVTSRYVGLFPKGDNSCDQLGDAYELYFSDKVLAYGDYPPPWIINVSKEDSEESANIQNPIKTYADEWTIRFITGDKSLDKWDEYVKKIQDMGIDKVLKINNDALAKLER